MRNLILTIIFLGIIINVNAQNKEKDTLQPPKKINYKPLILPATLIGYGFIGLKNKQIKNLNHKIQRKITANKHRKLKIDDFFKHANYLSVYGLNALGIKGKNSLKDRTIILGTAYLTTGITVLGLKKITGIKRPDGSNKSSFPSGHTAIAFMGAEFLHQEYKEKSVWYGISGYLVATGTGFLRIYNNKHWFSDVVTGAGIGILSTKFAYWIQPHLKKTIFKSKEKTSGVVVPFYNGKEYGLALSMSF